MAPSDPVNLSKPSRHLARNEDVGIELVQLHSGDDGSDTEDEPENIDEDDDSSGVGDIVIPDKEKSTTVESMAQMPDDSKQVKNKTQEKEVLPKVA
jgi:hypothetical protein